MMSPAELLSNPESWFVLQEHDQLQGLKLRVDLWLHNRTYSIYTM